MKRKMTLEQRRDWLLDFLNSDLDKLLRREIINYLLKQKFLRDPYSQWTLTDIIRAYPDTEAGRVKLKEDQAYLRKGLWQVIEAKDEEVFWTMGPVELYRYKSGGEFIEDYRLLQEEMDTDEFRLDQVLGQILEDFPPDRFAQCPECQRFIYVKSRKSRGYCKSCSNKIRTEEWRSDPVNREAEAMQRKLRHSGIRKNIEEIRKSIPRRKRNKKN